MISALLIANRGEIACRVIRTARRMGIRTVAEYSDADAKALHVRMADEAVHIGPSPAVDSYLRGERIIEAAKQTNAAAIHPGYGFLSENAEFAQAVIGAGLVWVGPKPDSIRAMGLKDAAKTLMADAGVPVTPGYLGDDQAPERLKAEADAIGYPILIKAVAGGGGKGMRKVESAQDFDDALESCRREAASSFGNDVVLIEKWIESPRHIEVQVFGDSHGNVVHLFERDCSLQRRHQKVVEEAPAPGMDEATRAAVCSAAVRAAQAVNYEGAGTVEFIADASEGLRGDRIWFMEMNTRLQVEHPVTEEITGQDLVEWQLRVASGEPLPMRQDELSIYGHAIEARLYAEDPAKGFLPSVGRLEHFDLGDAGRIETGVEEGDTISAFYDPMIAKLVASGDDRPAAIEGLIAMLEQVEVWPVKTNAWFIRNCLEDESFKAGTMTTGLVADSGELLTTPRSIDDDLLQIAGDGLTLVSTEGPRKSIHFDQVTRLRGLRLNSPPQRQLRARLDGEPILIELNRNADELLDLGWKRPAQLEVDGRIIAFARGQYFEIELDVTRGSVGRHGLADGVITAPMPGKIASVDVAQGETVAKGQRLLTLEAMKMEHGLVAPFDGVVAELSAEPGAQVVEGAVLAKVEPASPPA
ncbi:MAG: acetyl/propionyl/methylcrotonyl-CoA carboxylase subunit alpha [Pseudomonadota bacterium]|nr:acetyl/propionyl/methylcrotonyl-CoA carboxylase subunit alpha [Pseudomonadota bacterium]